VDAVDGGRDRRTEGHTHAALLSPSRHRARARRVCGPKPAPSRPGSPARDPGAQRFLVERALFSTSFTFNPIWCNDVLVMEDHPGKGRERSGKSAVAARGATETARGDRRREEMRTNWRDRRKPKS